MSGPTYYLALSADEQDVVAERILEALQGRPGMAGLTRERIRSYLDRKARKQPVDDFTNSERIAIDSLVKKGNLSLREPPEVKRAEPAPVPEEADEAPSPTMPLEVVPPTPPEEALDANPPEDEAGVEAIPTQPEETPESTPPEPTQPEPALPAPDPMPTEASAALASETKPCLKCGRAISPDFIVCPFCGELTYRPPPVPTVPPDDAWLERLAEEMFVPPKPSPSPLEATPPEPPAPATPAAASSPAGPAKDPVAETNHLLDELNRAVHELSDTERLKESERSMRLLMGLREARAREQELRLRVQEEALRATPPPIPVAIPAPDVKVFIVDRTQVAPAPVRTQNEAREVSSFSRRAMTSRNYQQRLWRDATQRVAERGGAEGERALRQLSQTEPPSAYGWGDALAVAFITFAVLLVALSAVGYVYGTVSPGPMGPMGWIVLAVVPTLFSALTIGITEIYGRA